MIGRVCCGAQLLCATFAILLAACSGGGGGDGGDGGPALSVSTTSVTFTAIQNGPAPASQQVGVSISGGTVFVGISSVVGSTFFALFQITGQTTGAVTVTPSSPTMAPGTYTGTITVRGCSTQNCSSGDVAGSPRTINVSYTVHQQTIPITASPNPLNFSYVTGSAAPAAQTVTLLGDPAPWTASANQPWIGITPSSGPGGGSVSVSVDPTGLAPNTYNGTITFTAAGNTATVNVSLSVAVPGIQTSQDSLSFSGINGATLPSQSLNVGMNNGAALNWTAATPAADTWLVLNRTSGTQADPLVVSVNSANGPLASGPYSSSITLTGSFGSSPLNKTINVALTLTKATLMANPVSVTLGGANGRDLSGVPVQLSLNTGANSFAWNSPVPPSFVQRSPSSGSVSATPQTVTLTPNASGLTGGTRSGSVGFSLQINGDAVSATVPVTFNLDSHKLLVDGNGVAFTKTPTLSKLTQALRVRDNLGLATNWSASSDQTWLLVTPSGTAGGDLVLTANPTGLTADSVSLATVTITSSDASVENTEKVRVGLWVGSTDPDPTTTLTGLPFIQIVADPIRPYVYSSTRNSIGFGRDIIIANVYTASAPPPILNVGIQIGAMAVSHDGSTLYAFDNFGGRIVPVDLDTYVVGTPFTNNSLSDAVALVYTRTNGVPLVIKGAGQIFNATTGAQLDATFPGQAVAASLNGSRICNVDIGNGSYFLACPTLDFTSLNGGKLLFGNFSFVSGVGVNAADIAISPDGTIAYVASGAGNIPPELSLYSTQSLSHLSGFSIQGRGNNVEIAADGRIFAGSTNVSIGQTADVRVFDADGNLLTTRLIAPVGPAVILDRQMKVSGDGLRLITITGNPPLTGSMLILTNVAP